MVNNRRKWLVESMSSGVGRASSWPSGLCFCVFRELPNPDAGDRISRMMLGQKAGAIGTCAADLRARAQRLPCDTGYASDRENRRRHNQPKQKRRGGVPG
jgi:hypothetical protein